ncbi:MAG: hypothetical protein P1U83_17770 [Roseovarius sp.]|nr:hypothetical protein [Roseovarius sp.]
MIMGRLFMGSVILAVGACSAPSQQSAPRGYDLALSHPSPYANYIQVTPATRSADLPDPKEIVSRDFSLYLRKSTGCVLDASRPASVLGSKQVPAGYMVPIVCP